MNHFTFMHNLFNTQQLPAGCLLRTGISSGHLMLDIQVWDYLYFFKVCSANISKCKKISGVEDNQGGFHPPEDQVSQQPLGRRNGRMVDCCTYCYYTVFKKKLHPFYFCNNFVDPGPIWIIFGRYVANEFSSGLHGLWYHAGLSVSDTDT